ncbi:MAG: saccharopine dehydrogenase family protein [Candidatus Paceibacterota bacterium]|jgi:saccharopine dehydrogenase (NAD+, L-lysine-forming)
MAKILVIGSGNVGRVGLHKMAQYPEIFSDIHVVSRTTKNSEAVKASILKKTRGKVKINVHQGDAGDKKFLLELFKKVKPDILVHFGLSYDNLVIMDVCLEMGVNYIDTCCYEDPKKYGFSYKLQLAKDKDFKKKGLLAVTGLGFAPGVTNIFAAYARDYLFDKIDTIDIIDCNGGSKDKKIKFAPNFNPEINLRELILPISFWEKGKWQKRGRLIDEDASFFEFDFPETGKFTPYLMYHEELETLVSRIPHLKRARFWMTFSPVYLSYLRVLFDVGMTRIDPVKYNGCEVVPVKFLKALLPTGDDFNEGYKGKTIAGDIISGVKDGKKKVVYVYNVTDHHKAFLETGGNGIGYNTAVPTVACAKLMLEGKWGGSGVKVPEDKTLDSKVFLEEMDKMGLPWVVKKLKDLPLQLKKNY